MRVKCVAANSYMGSEVRNGTYSTMVFICSKRPGVDRVKDTPKLY